MIALSSDFRGKTNYFHNLFAPHGTFFRSFIVHIERQLIDKATCGVGQQWCEPLSVFGDQQQNWAAPVLFGDHSLPLREAALFFNITATNWPDCSHRSANELIGRRWQRSSINGSTSARARLARAALSTTLSGSLIFLTDATRTEPRSDTIGSTRAEQNRIESSL